MADWFEPGYKAGGPIRSVVNFANNFSNDLEIFVLTTDRDLGDTQAYNGITADQWISYNENVQVFYASPQWLSWSAIKNAVRKINPDIIYLNSMYSKFYSLYPLLMKRAGMIPGRIILAPRGMLKQSAVEFKQGKKKIFLKLFRTLGLQRNVHFHCTDATEQADVKKYFGEVRSTVLANSPGTQKKFQPPPYKTAGSAKLIFIGRMHPIKNLHYLLELLKDVKQNISLTVIAGLEDRAYNEECQNLAKRLPAHVSVDFKGELAHHELEAPLQQHHLFVLPTKGENFGHAIFEALSAGRPALISDQTPWRKLEDHKAGWDVSLDQPQQFAAAIEKVAAMDNETMNEWCRGAWNFCNNYLKNSDIRAAYLKLFS